METGNVIRFSCLIEGCLDLDRGFQSFVGSLDLDLDSWTKQMRWSPFHNGAIDWMRASDDGNYSHFAERDMLQ